MTESAPSFSPALLTSLQSTEQQFHRMVVTGQSLTAPYVLWPTTLHRVCRAAWEAPLDLEIGISYKLHISRSVTDLRIPRRRCCLQACHSERTAVVAMNRPKTRVITAEDDSDAEVVG